MEPNDFMILATRKFLEDLVLKITILDVNTHTTVIVDNSVPTYDSKARDVDNAFWNRFFEPGFRNKGQADLVAMKKLLNFVHLWYKRHDICKHQLWNVHSPLSWYFRGDKLNI